MDRRQFLASAAVGVSLNRMSGLLAADQSHQGDRTFATPEEARKSPREELAYVTCGYAGTGAGNADYLATLDIDPASKTYSQVVHRLPMPNIGDELHHFGWNACASCHGVRARRYLIVPGLV